MLGGRMCLCPQLIRSLGGSTLPVASRSPTTTSSCYLIVARYVNGLSGGRDTFRSWIPSYLTDDAVRWRRFPLASQPQPTSLGKVTDLSLLAKTLFWRQIVGVKRHVEILLWYLEKHRRRHWSQKGPGGQKPWPSFGCGIS